LYVDRAKNLLPGCTTGVFEKYVNNCALHEEPADTNTERYCKRISESADLHTPTNREVKTDTNVCRIMALCNTQSDRIGNKAADPWNLF